MPRFFIDTYDNYAVIDDDGYDLPDVAAARALVKRSLIDLAADEAQVHSSAHVRAEVRDEAGNQIMSASVKLSLDWCDEPNGGVQGQ